MKGYPMTLENLNQYASELENLIKLEVKTEDDTLGHLVVTETKETYLYEDEESADMKINEARQNALFASATKKYKAGKVNKSGEITKPETWTVVIKLNH